MKCKRCPWWPQIWHKPSHCVCNEPPTRRRWSIAWRSWPDTSRRRGYSAACAAACSRRWRRRWTDSAGNRSLSTSGALQSGNGTASAESWGRQLPRSGSFLGHSRTVDKRAINVLQPAHRNGESPSSRTADRDAGEDYYYRNAPRPPMYSYRFRGSQLLVWSRRGGFSSGRHARGSGEMMVQPSTGIFNGEPLLDSSILDFRHPSRIWNIHR